MATRHFRHNPLFLQVLNDFHSLPHFESEAAPGSVKMNTGVLTFQIHLFQSTVLKKMAAVHFTTLPCEPN